MNDSCLGYLKLHLFIKIKALATTFDTKLPMLEKTAKFLLMNAVSSISCIRLHISHLPSCTIHQSLPGILFLLVSQPSIHLPYSVNSSALKTASSAFSIFSAEANQSSVANIILPPTCTTDEMNG